MLGGPTQSPGSGPGWPELVSLPAILHPALPLLVHPVRSHSYAAVGKVGEEVEGVVPTTGWLFSGPLESSVCLARWQVVQSGPCSWLCCATTLIIHFIFLRKILIAIPTGGYRQEEEFSSLRELTIQCCRFYSEKQYRKDNISREWYM